MQPTALLEFIVPSSPLPFLTAKDVGLVKFKLPVVKTHCVSVCSLFNHYILRFKTCSKGLKAIEVRLTVLLVGRLACFSSLFLKYRHYSTAVRLCLQTRELLQIIVVRPASDL